MLVDNQNPVLTCGLSQQDDYFRANDPPAHLQQVEDAVSEFVNIQQHNGRRVVLVTSGGTTVPLENQTVRFVDNFSVGTRGAISAEQFIAEGYAVVFLHRRCSLRPFSRQFAHTEESVFSILEVAPTGEVRVRDSYREQARRALAAYQSAMDNHQLLLIEFTTIAEYLFLLRACVQGINCMGESAMYYLAAAVSDFFIPKSKMAEHKIQSSEGQLSLQMEQVPKFLRLLVKEWAPRGLVVSFKLETDPSLLESKARQALEKYGHQVVIANILATRKRIVYIVKQQGDPMRELCLSDAEADAGRDIETIIIPELIGIHNSWIRPHIDCKVTIPRLQP